MPVSNRAMNVVMRVVMCVALLATAGTAWSAQSPAPGALQEFWASIQDRDWDAAIASARQLVDAARQPPSAPDKLSSALTLLGTAQLGKGDFVAAQAAFGEALSTLEPVARSIDARLIEPLRGMGQSLAAQSKHADAVPYLEKALLILRRTSGLLDLRQQDLLRSLAFSLSELGRPDLGAQHMQYLVRVGEHAYGASDPRMASVMCVVGDWYLDRALILEARDFFRRALSIVERKKSEDDAGVVEPLRGYARSYVRELLLSNYGIRVQADPYPSGLNSGTGEVKPMDPRLLSSEGERALLRALAILDANPARSADTLVETLVQLGDWYQIKQQPQKAMPLYQRALASLPADASEARRKTLLSFPVQVYYPTPELATRNLGKPESEVVQRFVQVEFTVSADGSVKDERITDQDATSRQQSQALEAVHASRYRPKFVDGQPVETTAMSYRQTYKQRRDKDEKEKETE